MCRVFKCVQCMCVCVCSAHSVLTCACVCVCSKAIVQAQVYLFKVVVSYAPMRGSLYTTATQTVVDSRDENTHLHAD